MENFTETTIGQFLIEVAKGSVKKHRLYTRWGRSVDLDKNQVITVGGGAGLFDFTGAAEVVDIVSDSADDTLLGTGLRKALIIGIDENYNRVSEIVDLNGLTPVQTVNQYIFISNVFSNAIGTEVGSNEVNSGLITGIGDSSLKQFFEVQSGDGTANALFDIVPADRDLYITQVQLTAHKFDASGKPIVKFQSFIQPFGFGKTLVREDTVITDANNIYNLSLSLPYKIPARSRYWITAQTDVNNTQVEGTVIGFTVKK